MGGFDFQKCPTGTPICRRIQPIGVHPCFTTIISSTGRYGSSYKKSRASADDGRVSRSVEDVDPTVQMEIQGSKVGGEPAGGEAGEGRNVRMMRHLKQIGAFGLPAVMVPLADPGEMLNCLSK